MYKKYGYVRLWLFLCYRIESRVCTTKHCSLMVTQYLLLITNTIPFNPFNHFRPWKV